MKLLQAAVKRLEECNMQGMGQGMGQGGPNISPNGLMSFMVGRNRAEEEEGTEDGMGPEDENAEADVVTMDVPLLIRIMELAREDIKDDATLHHVAKKMIDLAADGDTLSMDHYEEIISNMDLAGGDEEMGDDEMGGDEMSQDDVQGM